MVGMLQRKLLRDMGAAKAQYGAVVLVVILGVAVFGASYAAYQNLYRSYEGSYRKLGMADYWISLDRIPAKAARDINEITGVTAQGRIVGQVSLPLEGESGARIEGRVISLPAENHPRINDVHIEEGSYFASGAKREVLLEKHFAEYHGLNTGDWLAIKTGDTRARYRISGIVTSPEYIWVAKSAQEPFTSPRTFGVLYLPETQAENVFGMEGQVNEIDLILASDAEQSQVFDEVREILKNHHIKRLTSKDEPLPIATRKIDILSGVRTAHMIAREDHVGNKLLKMDLEGFREIAELFPALFLTMAALAIYVLLNRLVESQRAQIGLMQALGYSKVHVAGHYLSFALLVGVLGSIIGAALGYGLASALTRTYAAELRLPFVTVATHWGIIATGMLIGIFVPLVSALIPAWTALRMYPAEAMRPPTPAAGRRSPFEILLPFLSRLPQMLKLPLRNIFRNLRRSLFMATGVASAIILILVSMSFVDAMQSALYTQFERLQNFDARVIFEGTGSTETASYIGHLKGVQQAEAILEMPYRIRHENHVADTSILGLPEQSSMYNLLTPTGSPIDVVDDGVLLTQSLKRKLQVEVGDQLELEPVVGTVGQTEKRLAEFVDEPLGNRAYLPLEETQAILRTPGAASGVLLRFNQEPSPRLLERLYDIPQTASIEFAGETRQFVDQLMGFFWVFIGVMLIMGIALGLAIVFNGVTINVLERRREFAVMRAVGMSRTRLSLILSIESLVTGFLGVVAGVWAGRYIAHYFLSLFETDIFSMGAVIFPRTYAIATSLALAVLLVALIPAIRQIYRLSLPAVTKTWSE